MMYAVYELIVKKIYKKEKEKKETGDEVFFCTVTLFI